jgi:hypothetical protein
LRSFLSERLKRRGIECGERNQKEAIESIFEVEK